MPGFLTGITQAFPEFYQEQVAFARSSVALRLPEREDISRGIAAQLSMRAISVQINRNGGYDNYRATHAEQAAWDRALRPKNCMLACHKHLSHIVATKLKSHWLPQQIAGWLKKENSKREDYYVSHETIYKTLYIQTRGALKKELLQHLRTMRIMRRSKHASLKGQGLGKI